jgi:hypothetical protein
MELMASWCWEVWIVLDTYCSKLYIGGKGTLLFIVASYYEGAIDFIFCLRYWFWVEEASYQNRFLLFSYIIQLTYSSFPQDSGAGEGSWAGLCFSPSQWSMVIAFFIALILCVLIYTLAIVNIISISIEPARDWNHRNRWLSVLLRTAFSPRSRRWLCPLLIVKSLN